MIPILFNKNETTFTSNGLGRLTDAISCKVTEEKNGQFELEIIYPIDGVLFDSIENDMIIGAIPSVGASLQAFDIYSISKPLSGKVIINARHISYRLSHIVTTGANVAASGTACATALTSLKTNAILATGQTCPFTFWTDVTTVASFAKSVPASIRSRLGGSEGSILDQFGGEYEWDNFTVKLHAHRGIDSNISIRYGKNLTDLTQEEDIGNTITGCVGYWRSESDMVVGDVQLSSNHASAPREKIVSVDFTQSLGAESKPTKQQVNNAAQIYANRHNLPNVNMKVSLVDLAQTEEYKEYAPMEQLHLCDYVYVIFEKLGVSQYAKVIKTVYNVLLDKYDSLEIGDNISTLFETITDNLAAEIDAVSYAALNATAWLTKGNGYVVAVKNEDGSWKELLFMDTNDTQTARNVLRLNTNGLGFSTTGVNGTYTNAWTIDGHLVADFIDTGTLNASLVEVTNINASNITTGSLDASKVNVTKINAGNITTGTLSADRIGANSISVSKLSGTITNGQWQIDLDNGTMAIGKISANNITAGTIDASVITVKNIDASKITTGTMTADKIKGGTLTLGGSDTDGKLQVKDASNNTILLAQKDKIEISGNKFTVSSSNFNLTANGTLTANNATLRNITCENFTLDGDFSADCNLGELMDDEHSLSINNDGITLQVRASVVEPTDVTAVNIDAKGVYYYTQAGGWERIG